MPYLTGDKLKNEMNKENLGCSPMVEEFLIKDSVTMFTSQPGIGKSVGTINIAASASCQSPVFQYLQCHGNYKTVYLQLEGSLDEQLSRLKCLNEIIPIDYNNISWHTTPVIAENQKTWDPLLRELEEVAPFDFFFMDPIYKATMYGLKKEESVLSLIKLIDTIRSEFRPSVLLNNHETKESYGNNGQPIEKDDPFYGSQWLKAYVDTSFNIRKGDHNEINFLQKKDRSGSIIDKFSLLFDPATFGLKFIIEKSDLSARHKVKKFLKAKFDNNSFTVTNEICRETGISKRHVLRMKADNYFDDFVSFLEKDELTWTRKV